MQKRRTTLLLTLTVAGVAAGAVGGWLLGGHGLGAEGQAAFLAEEWRGPAIRLVEFPGTVFLNILKMLVLPLVAASMVCGVASLGPLRSAGKLGFRAVAYYAFTTLIATIIGIVLVTAIAPGVDAGLTADSGALEKLPGAVREGKGALERLLDAVLQMFPPNLAQAAADFNVLGLIVFSMALGLVLGMIGEPGKPVLAFFEGLNAAIMKIVDWVVWLVPLGVASLVAAKLGSSGDFFGQLEKTMRYALTVLAGLAIHGLLVLPLIYLWFCRRNPFSFLKGMGQASLTAFGTASSAATLPVTIAGVEAMGVSPRVSRFMLPLGATVNMDGTALYEAVSVIWIAQMLGVELGLAELCIVALTATLAAIGAAAIPSAGLVTMVMVLGAVGLAEQGIGFLGFIYAIDWALDRFRTTVNVQGDAIGAAVVDAMENRYREPGPQRATT